MFEQSLRAQWSVFQWRRGPLPEALTSEKCYRATIVRCANLDSPSRADLLLCRAIGPLTGAIVDAHGGLTQRSRMSLIRIARIGRCTVSAKVAVMIALSPMLTVVDASAQLCPGTTVTSGLRRPMGMALSNQGNVLVSETGTATRTAVASQSWTLPETVELFWMVCRPGVATSVIQRDRRASRCVGGRSMRS